MRCEKLQTLQVFKVKVVDFDTKFIIFILFLFFIFKQKNRLNEFL